MNRTQQRDMLIVAIERAGFDNFSIFDSRLESLCVLAFFEPYQFEIFTAGPFSGNPGINTFAYGNANQTSQYAARNNLLQKAQGRVHKQPRCTSIIYAQTWAKCEEAR